MENNYDTFIDGNERIRLRYNLPFDLQTYQGQPDFQSFCVHNQILRVTLNGGKSVKEYQPISKESNGLGVEITKIWVTEQTVQNQVRVLQLIDELEGYGHTIDRRLIVGR
jgi:hypothetical protein